jgi:hypothetical protein
MRDELVCILARGNDPLRVLKVAELYNVPELAGLARGNDPLRVLKELQQARQQGTPSTGKRKRPAEGIESAPGA